MNAANTLNRYRTIVSILIFILPSFIFCQIPINNDPCPTDANPPFDLTTVGTHLGTTCEATFDFANVECSASTQDASVWYSYTPNAIDDGYDITLSSVGGSEDAEGPITMEVYKGTVNEGCTGIPTTIGASCTSTNATIKIPNNFISGQLIHIKITTASSTDNCGEFNISIVPASCGEFANVCEDITSLQTLNPITSIDFEINYTCASGCIDYASPDPTATGGCDEFADNPTIWFKLNVDDNAQQLLTTVNTAGNWDAVWSIYGGDDCANLDIISVFGQTCSNEDVTPELFQIAVEPIYSTYWMAITVDPNSIPITGIDDGTFEVCVTTIINAIVCIGELEGDCAEPSLVIEVTERELTGQSLDGPFCPGEEVTIKVSFTYDASETSADWLSGIVPKFGTGWNIEDFDFTASPPVGNGETATWHVEGEDCAASIQENVSHLCTYIDENGNLALCNALCESCTECPSIGMSIDDPLPSGYYWVSTGTSSNCSNDCSPNGGFGIGALVVLINWEFTIKVKDFIDYESCFENSDLQISFQTFSQGIVGCWEDPFGECLIDKSQFGPLWKVDCIIPSSVIGENEDICSDGTTNVIVNTIDGSTNTIIVEAIDNPLVTGESNHTFAGGSGIINDNLVNLSDDLQVVQYQLYSEDFSLTCSGAISSVLVNVYPDVLIDFNSGHICEGECTIIFPEIFGGSSPPYEYVWSTGEVTPEIEVCPVATTSYSVTIVDEHGCFAIAEIPINVAPLVEISLPEYISVCKDDVFDPNNPDYFVCLDFLGGTSPFEVTWAAEPGLVGSAAGAFGECFIINEVGSSEFAGINGQLILSALVIDDSGCTDMTEMIVEITGKLTVVVDVFDIECGETEATIFVSGFDAVGNPVTTYLLYGGCPDDDLGEFLGEFNPVSGTVNFPPIDLLSYTCYTIVAQTEEDCQVIQNITIPLVEPVPIAIDGQLEICEGDSTLVTISNYEDFAIVELNGIGINNETVLAPDTTSSYTVVAAIADGCISNTTFTIKVNSADSQLCADPCENQTSDFQITGIAYSDDNANGVQDPNESPLGNVLIKYVENDFTVFTNLLGGYAIPVNQGDVQLQASVSQGQWSNPEIDKNVLVEIPCVTGVNFGFIPFGNAPLTNISVNNTITRCDWETKFIITVENQNHESINGKIVFTFDDKTTFFSSDINGIQVSNNKATFETGILLGFTPKDFVLTLKMPSGSSVIPLLDFTAEIFEEDKLLDSYSYSTPLLCSYDPNDKRTFPDRPGDENPTLKEESLEYGIRFQNNGNDTAFHVRIVDVLDPNIVQSSIRFISSSHTFAACISGDSLIVDFENIMLVDSMTNYDASQGYVSFRCEVDPNVVFDTEIFNTADIIFDANIPIVTNTILNTIVEEICSDDIIEVSETICQGEEFMGYEVSGNYQIDLMTELGCDSIINLELAVIQPETLLLAPITVCGEGISISILGTEYLIDSSGIYTHEVVGGSGCLEQIVNIDVTLIEAQKVFEEFTICEGDSLIYENNYFEVDSTGVYVFEFFNQDGCVEYIFNFDVTIINIEEAYQAFEICGEGSLIFNDTTFEFDSSGIYTYLIEGETGCDELELTLDITLNPIVYSELDTTICEGQSYEGLEVSGVYTFESEDPITGCLVFETLTLTVLPLSDPKCIVGVLETNDFGIEVYPIPTSNTLIVKGEIELQNITIISTTGKILSLTNNINSQELKIDVTQLPNGFHLLMIDTEAGRIMKKVIIGR